VTLWLAGRNGEGEDWQVLGVYGTHERAVARCRSALDFIGPLELDQDAPEPPTEWPGVERPVLARG
jgi:hypothetical protein